MDFAEYEREASRTRPHYQSEDEHLLIAVMGIVGEGAELLEHLKKYRAQGHPLDKNRMRLESGDILWYLADLVDVLEITLGELADMNIIKLRARYPEGFSAERSMMREDEVI